MVRADSHKIPCLRKARPVVRYPKQLLDSMYSNLTLTIFFLASFITPSLSQEKGLRLNASITNSNVSKQSDLSIKLIFKNQTDKEILIHKHISFGYLSLCEDDYCFEVEKKENKKYKKLQETANIDKSPGFDSTGMAWDDMYDTLKIGQRDIQEFNINGYYLFDKGEYRVRFSIQLPKKNNLANRKIYSNWIYFEVQKKHIPLYLPQSTGQRTTNGFGQVWLDKQNFSSYALFNFGSGWTNNFEL